jgi:hypothetical protein
MTHRKLDVSVQISTIAKVGRLLCAIGVGIVVLLQPAVALAASSPSPSLDGLLAAPPGSDFVELPATTPNVFAGAFDAQGFVTIDGTPDPTNDQKTMEADGFLSGFGKTWVQRSVNHALIEAVLAFKGGLGAGQWMRQLQAADKSQPEYKNAVTVDGISNYYGEHLYDATNVVYSDAFVMVKGNDAFLVVAASPKDDLGTIGSTQAKKQYDAAPAQTIPQAEWPESKVVNVVTTTVKVVGGVLVGILIILAIAVVVIVTRSRRRPMLQAVPVMGGPGGVAPVPIAAVQMSDDRRSWWDGTTWKDAEHEAPPSAQRSSDGQFWWDGQTWRPIPGAPSV